MEDNDEIYVMADANSPQLAPIKPKRKTCWIFFGSLAAVIAIFGVILAYVLMAKTPPVAEHQSQGNNKPVATTPNPAISPVQSKTSTTLTQPLKEELTINFPFNSTEVKPVEISQIESLWSKAKDGKGKVIIAGHADDLGAEKYNQELSQKRAENVAKVLQQMGIDNRYQVIIQGFGETKPVAENTREQGRALNRRVEISFNLQK